MPIAFTCPHCGVQTDVDERYAGQTGPCVQCGKTVTVPGSWTTHHPGPGSSSGGAAVAIVAVVVVAILGLAVCAGLVGFLFVARSAPPSSVRVQMGPQAQVSIDAGSMEESIEGAATPDAPGFTWTRRQRPDGNVTAVIRSGVAEARGKGQKPFVQIGQDNPRCRALKDSLGDPRMNAALAGAYVIYLDLDDWGAVPGFDVTQTPAFFEIDEQGRPTGRTIDAGAWDQDTPEKMAPPLKAFFQGEAGGKP